MRMRDGVVRGRTELGSRNYGFVLCKLGETCDQEMVNHDGFYEAQADAQATRLLMLAIGRVGA